MDMGAAQLAATKQRPDLYGYHDYRDFLTDLLAHLKAEIGVSVRQLAHKSGVSESYISMVLSGTRGLSINQLKKLATALELSRADVSYLGWLIALEESPSYDEKIDAVKKIQRFRTYQKLNPLEVETFRYLEHWYHVAIRELAALPGFKIDPDWIQASLRFPVSIKEIKQALVFLFEHDYIRTGSTGESISVERNVHCKTGVLKPVLSKFHAEMLGLAAQSILAVPTDSRNVSSHTCAIPIEAMPDVKRILDEARDKIRELSDQHTKTKNVVYHFGFLAFPLTKKMED